MATILPARPRDGDRKTGVLPALMPIARISRVLGFPPNVVDDPHKVTASWAFTVDGHYVAIWDYCGKRWSTLDPAGVLPALFGLKPADCACSDLLAPAPRAMPVPPLQLRLF